MILYESFEEGQMPPTDWQVFSNGNNYQKWVINDKLDFSSGVYDGNYSAWIDPEYYPESDWSADEWLVSPLIDTALLTDLKLTFMAYSKTDKPNATMKVWVTDDTGAPLTAEPTWDMIRDETWLDLSYRQATVDLSGFNRHEPLRLAWQYVGEDGQRFALDLIQFTGNVDVTWLTREPTNGVIAPDGGQAEITVGFDANGLEPGDYYANLNVIASPNPLINIPVALKVIEGTGPIVSDIPDQAITLGESFETILLDDYVVDVDHSDEQISWFSSGNSALIVTIDGNRVATISYPPDWTGSETITFTATDPDEQLDFTTAIFTVLPEGSKIFLPLILR